MNHAKSAVAQAQALVSSFQVLLLDSAPSVDALTEIANRLRQFATASVWQLQPFRPSGPDEEKTYELAVSAADGPSLYLVSDGVSVTSPPHRHDTWAVVAGIAGHEANHCYAVRDRDQSKVSRTATVVIGPGETFVLQAHDIHSTQVAGSVSTLHLHLYGRPLNLLPSFESRCLRVSN